MARDIPSVQEIIRAAAAPCLVLREEDVEQVNRKCKEEAWASEACARLLKETQGWIDTDIQIPERGGQWPHWYSCEADGARLETAGPTEHRCPRCGKVYSGEPWDSVPLTEVHNGLSRAALSLAVNFALTGNRAAAEKAAEILLGYAARYPAYPVRDHGQRSDTPWASKVSWGTLGESSWLVPICGSFDLIRHEDILTPAQHQLIREQLLRPAANLILKNNLGIHNIQCWHDAAIGCAGLMLRDRELVAFAVEGEAGIKSQMTHGILPDGVWFEGSWGYHFYAMKPLLALSEALRNCGHDVYDDDFKQMFEAPLFAAQPDGGLPAFNDASGATLPTHAGMYEIALARYGDTTLAVPLTAGPRTGLEALLYGVASLPETSKPPGSTGLLPHAGFAFLRQGPPDDETYLALDYGPHGGGHGHPDKLGIVLYGKGQLLAPDPGSVAFGIPVHQNWYKQTVSHNTVVVDGESQRPSTGTLDFLARGSDFDLVSVSAPYAYEGVKLNRTLVLMHDLVILQDRMAGETQHNFDWVYHNRGTLRTSFQRKRVSAVPERGSGYDQIQKVACGTPEANWTATWRAGDAGLRLTMLSAAKGATEVITGLGLDNDGSETGAPGEQLTPLVIARRRGRRTTFRAALQLYGKRPVSETLSRAVVTPAPRARGVVVERKATRYALISTLSPGPVEWEDITFEGQALFSHHTSRTDRVVLAMGSELKWGDASWTVSPAGSVEFARTSRGVRLTNLGQTAVQVGEGDARIPLGPGQKRIPTRA